MAHGRVGPDLVMNTRYVSASEIRSVSEHELNRTPDGSSSIDPLRSHLNEVLHGPRTQTEAISQAWANGVRPPAKQAERPYVQTVLSASAEYFRDDGMGPGQWNQDKLDAWLVATMGWLKAEYGDDLAHVSLHLDEDTPHLHVLVIPTYEKAARKPGRMKRGETPEQFEERKRIAAETVTRTAGRASSPYWSRHFARREARKSYHAAVESLGIGYGRDFVGEATGERPQPKTTGKWVREQAAELEAREKQLSEAEGAAARRATVQARWDARRTARLEARAVQVSGAEAAVARRTEIQTRWDARRAIRLDARSARVSAAEAAAADGARHAQEKAQAVLERAEQARIQGISEIETRRIVARADIKRERSKLERRSSELERASDKLRSGLNLVYVSFKFIAEKLRVPIPKSLNDALVDVEAALHEAEAALEPRATPMRIAAASAAPEEPSEESLGPGF